MAGADMVAAGQSIDRMAFTGEATVAWKRKILKLAHSPWFGRIDFTLIESKIGVHSLIDERRRRGLIYD